MTNIVNSPTTVQPGDFARVVVDVSDITVLEEREDATKVKACASASIESSQAITFEVARLIAGALRCVAARIEDRADSAEWDGESIN